MAHNHQLTRRAGWKWTFEFRPERDGTRYYIRSEKLRGFRRRTGWALLRWPFFRQSKSNVDRLRRAIADELRERNDQTLAVESG